MTDTVLIFAKPPLIGLGKTRLARDIGRVEAWRFNRMAQAHVLAEVLAGARSRHWNVILCVAPDRHLNLALPGVWPAVKARAMMRRAQGRGDLGLKLARALMAVPKGRVLVIGTDTPQIRQTDLIGAFAALKTHHAVVGPAEDGGFWLAGFRKSVRWHPPFTGVRWSSEHALADMLANLEGSARQAPRKAIARLVRLTDADDGPSLRQVRAELARTRRPSSGRVHGVSSGA
jgi:uncharacterized protein